MVTGRDPGDLAADALVAAGVGDHVGAARAIRALADADALASAMHRWVDTLVDACAKCNVPLPAAPPRDTLPEHRRLVAAVQDKARWAEQFLEARAGMNLGACRSLIAAIPAGQARQHALSLVQAVSGRLYMLPVPDRDPWE